MEDTLATEFIQTIEMDPVQWDQLVDLLSTIATIDTMVFIVLCLMIGVLLGQILWRWMR